MPRFAANLSFLFTDLPFLDRFEAAARAGFKGVEFMFPYAVPAAEIKSRLDATGLSQVLFNLPPGDWAKGERGIGCHPGRSKEFQDGVAKAIDYAGALGCTRVNCLAGIRPRNVEPNDARETYIKNLQYAAPRLKDAGIKLLIEPVNTRDIPGFFLNYTKQALDIIKAVGSDNLFLHLDCYHMQMLEGHLAETIREHIHLVRHFQIAGVPGRHEPDVGEINYPYLFDLIDELGYSGWVGCEYRPRGDTREGLKWAARYGIGLRDNAMR